MGILRTLFVPSWRATLTNEKYKFPWQAAASTYQTANRHALDGLKHLEYANFILTQNISEQSQKKIIRRHKKLALFYYFCLLASLSVAITSGLAFTLSYIDNYGFPVIALTCSITLFKLWILNLHRAKQVIVGAFFPIRWMVLCWANISRFDEGVFYKGKLIHQAMPLWGETLRLLQELEAQSTAQ